MRISAILFLIPFLISCDGLRPEGIEVASYPEVSELLNQDYEKLHGKVLSKTAMLNQEEETKHLNLDSLGWKKELAFLEEMDPNQSKYVGSFDKQKFENEMQLVLKEGERGSLKEFSFITGSEGEVRALATVHEDKDVYVHHKDLEVRFIEGSVAEYTIIGYQKIMLKDTFFFKVRGKVN